MKVVLLNKLFLELGFTNYLKTLKMPYFLWLSIKSYNKISKKSFDYVYQGGGGTYVDVRTGPHLIS